MDNDDSHVETEPETSEIKNLPVQCCKTFLASTVSSPNLALVPPCKKQTLYIGNISPISMQKLNDINKLTDVGFPLDESINAVIKSENIETAMEVLVVEQIKKKGQNQRPYYSSSAIPNGCTTVQVHQDETEVKENF